MQNVPNIISTKDLSYICDMFNWNFTTAKKALNYSNNLSFGFLHIFLIKFQHNSNNLRKYLIFY